MPSNKIRIELPEEIVEKIEEQSQNEGTSRQSVISGALDWFYNPVSKLQESEQYRLDNIHKAELLAAKEQELQELRIMLEELRGEYALATTKLLPAAEKIMTPWWKRIFRRS
jgi:hypothetical protein